MGINEDVENTLATLQIMKESKIRKIREIETQKIRETKINTMEQNKMNKQRYIQSLIKGGFQNRKV